MLGKLIKHEFRATSRIMAPLLLIVLALSAVVRFSIQALENSEMNFLNILAVLLIAAFAIGIIAVNLMSIIIMIQRFYKNLLGEEGYLMFTLPTSVHSIVWSKLIVSIVWFLATAIIMVLIVAVMAMSTNALAEMKVAFSAIGEFFRRLGTGNTIGYIAEILLIMFLASAAMCLQFYAAMALGHSFANHKGLLSVVFFFAISFVIQIITTQIVVWLGSSDVLSRTNIFPAETLEEALRAIHWGFLSMAGYLLVTGGACYAITTITLKKRLNLA